MTSALASQCDIYAFGCRRFFSSRSVFRAVLSLYHSPRVSSHRSPEILWVINLPNGLRWSDGARAPFTLSADWKRYQLTWHRKKAVLSTEVMNSFCFLVSPLHIHVYPAFSTFTEFTLVDTLIGSCEACNLTKRKIDLLHSESGLSRGAHSQTGQLMRINTAFRKIVICTSSPALSLPAAYVNPLNTKRTWIKAQRPYCITQLQHYAPGL